MNNVLQYLVYLIVGIFSISGIVSLVLLLEFITRQMSQILSNFDRFKHFVYWLSNNNIINNILYCVAVIAGVLLLIMLLAGLGKMVLGQDLY